MGFRRLSENTVSAAIGAVAFATLSAGTAVAVSTSAVSITNPTTGRRAHVTGKDSLVTSDRDALTGAYAKIDGDGRQQVREGAPKAPHAVTMNGELLNGVYSSSKLAASPTGTFVIETITGQVRVSNGAARPMLTLRTYPKAGVLSEIQVPITGLVTNADGFDTYVFTLPVRAYHVPGQGHALITIANRSNNTGNTYYHLTAIGHVA